MEPGQLVDRFSGSACLLFGVLFLLLAVVPVLLRRIRGEDLPGPEAMRSKYPAPFRTFVLVCRYGGPMFVGLGGLIGIAAVGAFLAALDARPIDVRGALGALVVTAGGFGLSWLALRWCRWGWQTTAE